MPVWIIQMPVIELMQAHCVDACLNHSDAGY